jgi:hypothetical protein
MFCIDLLRVLMKFIYFFWSMSSQELHDVWIFRLIILLQIFVSPKQKDTSLNGFVKQLIFEIKLKIF